MTGDSITADETGAGLAELVREAAAKIGLSVQNIRDLPAGGLAVRLAIGATVFITPDLGRREIATRFALVQTALCRSTALGTTASTN